MKPRTILIIDIILSLLIVIVVVIICILLSGTKSTKGVENITYDSYEKIAQTGDIIIFSSKFPELRFALGSPWTHVGMVVKFPRESELVLYESNFQDSQQNLVDVFTGKKKVQGPQLVYLREKLRNYNGTFFVRRLLGPFDSDSKFHMLTPLFYKMDQFKFEIAPSFWIPRYPRIRRIPIPIPYKGKNARDRSRIFCSELVTYALSYFGAMKHGIKFYRMMPHHFAGGHWKSYMNRGWALTIPIAIIVK